MSRPVAVLVAAAALAVVVACVGMAAGAERHVYPGTGTTIQDAIDVSSSGDTVMCMPGVCRECGCVQADHADRR